MEEGACVAPLHQKPRTVQGPLRAVTRTHGVRVPGPVPRPKGAEREEKTPRTGKAPGTAPGTEL